MKQPKNSAANCCRVIQYVKPIFQPEKSSQAMLAHTVCRKFQSKMICLLSGILLIHPDSTKCLSVFPIRETRCLSHRERQQSQELCTPAFCLQYVLRGQRSDVSLGAVYHEDGLWDQGWRVKGGGESPPERPLGIQSVVSKLDHGEEPSSLYLKDIKTWTPRQRRGRPESQSLIPSTNN